MLQPAEPGTAPPLFATVPPSACRNLLPACDRIAHALGIELMPAQRRILALMTTINESGEGWRYPTIIVTTPRRVGKTTSNFVANVHRGLAFPNSRAYYTAQTGQDARDFYREATATVMRSALRKMAYKPRMAAGSEMLMWRNGSTFRPFSPQPDALHGKDTDLVTVDESWSLAPVRARDLIQAISPTQLTRPWRQMAFPSTAGNEASEWFHDLVLRGRESVTDPTSRTAFIEYGCPDDLDPCDPASWPLFHPAYGLTVTDDALRGELDRMGPIDFGRAYGNRWPAITSAGGWPEGVWANAQDPATAPAAPLTWGVDIAADRSRASVAVASEGPNVEIVDGSRPGVDWIGPRVAQLVAAHGGTVNVNVAGPAVTLPATLEKAGVTFHALTANEYAAACAALFDSVVSGVARIRPNRQLDDAQAAAGRRPIGEKWAWDRRAGVDISPLTAATCAVAGLAVTPEPAMPKPSWYVPA